MKNGDLIVHGKRADELNIEAFTEAEAMTGWEYNDEEYDFSQYPYELIKINSYGAYGAHELKFGPTTEDEAGTLHLIFGDEWADKFYQHKYSLVAKHYLEEDLAKQKDLEERIKRLRSVANKEVLVKSFNEIFDYFEVALISKI